MQTAMTPLIDVVFQLLIFFICASTGHMRELLLATDFRAGALGAPTQIEREKPLGEAWIRLKRVEEVTVVSLGDQEYRDQGKLIDALRSLAQGAIEIPVILDIAGDVPLGDVIQVYDACRAVRFQSVNFAADASRLKRKSNDAVGGQ